MERGLSASERKNNLTPHRAVLCRPMVLAEDTSQFVTVAQPSLVMIVQCVESSLIRLLCFTLWNLWVGRNGC